MGLARCALLSAAILLLPLRAVREWSRPARVAAHAIADLSKTKTELIADNALLRQQLIVANRQIKRALFSPSERATTTFLARLTRSWRDAMLLVQPDTVLRWHRQVFKLFCCSVNGTCDTFSANT